MSDIKIESISPEKFRGYCHVDPSLKKTVLEGDIGSRHIRIELEGGPGAILHPQQWADFLHCLARAMLR